MKALEEDTFPIPVRGAHVVELAVVGLEIGQRRQRGKPLRKFVCACVKSGADPRAASFEGVVEGRPFGVG